jgi:two-component system chemotaxis response regulator CheB
MQFTSIKLLIVDESPSFRAAVQKALGGDASIRVVGTAGSAGEAVRRIRELEPDVLAADPALPDLTEALAAVRNMRVLPVIAVGVRRPEPGPPGFCDFVRKPDLENESDFSSFCNELGVKVKISYRPHPAGPAGATSSAREARFHLIAIGASTGGTEATAEILRRLPGNLPGIVIVQHMPAGFTQMYAERLDRMCRFGVFEARDGDRVRPGTALVAPGGKQMSLKKDGDGYFVQCREGPKVNGHCPSVGFLFDSAAKTAGADAVGVILTGMGRDGAEGLLKMRKAGAYTIGQDRQSSVVYGMPMAAQEIGAVQEQAPCGKIADIIVRRLFG